MTLLEILAAIVGSAATALGAGFGGKWLATQRAKTKRDGDVALRSLSLVDDAREDTQRHVTEYVKCVEQCAALKAEARAMASTIERLEGKVDTLIGRLATVESENVELRARCGVLEEQVRNLLPEALGNYAATIDAGENVTPIRGREKAQ